MDGGDRETVHNYTIIMNLYVSLTHLEWTGVFLLNILSYQTFLGYCKKNLLKVWGWGGDIGNV